MRRDLRTARGACSDCALQQQHVNAECSRVQAAAHDNVAPLLLGETVRECSSTPPCPSSMLMLPLTLMLTIDEAAALLFVRTVQSVTSPPTVSFKGWSLRISTCFIDDFSPVRITSGCPMIDPA